MPPITAPRYSIDKLSAIELTIHPAATMMPPNATINSAPRCGPRMSTIQPSIGVSQVSRAMKMLNANWIAAMDQPCAWLIGVTNSVHPYCRLAIITMQTMTESNWLQRTAPNVFTLVPTVLATLMFPSPELFLMSLSKKPVGDTLRVSAEDAAQRVPRLMTTGPTASFRGRRSRNPESRAASQVQCPCGFRVRRCAPPRNDAVGLVHILT